MRAAYESMRAGLLASTVASCSVAGVATATTPQDTPTPSSLTELHWIRAASLDDGSPFSHYPRRGEYPPHQMAVPQAKVPTPEVRDHATTATWILGAQLVIRNRCNTIAGIAIGPRAPGPDRSWPKTLLAPGDGIATYLDPTSDTVYLEAADGHFEKAVQLPTPERSGTVTIIGNETCTEIGFDPDIYPW